MHIPDTLAAARHRNRQKSAPVRPDIAYEKFCVAAMVDGFADLRNQGSGSPTSVNTARQGPPTRSGLNSGDTMERRTFLNISGLAFGSMLVPVFGRAIAAEDLLSP